MDAIIKKLEAQIQLAFMTDTTLIKIDKFEALFIVDRLKEIRDKWYEEGENNDI